MLAIDYPHKDRIEKVHRATTMIVDTLSDFAGMSRAGACVYRALTAMIVARKLWPTGRLPLVPVVGKFVVSTGVDHLIYDGEGHEVLHQDGKVAVTTIGDVHAVCMYVPTQSRDFTECYLVDFSAPYWPLMAKEAFLEWTAPEPQGPVVWTAPSAFSDLEIRDRPLLRAAVEGRASLRYPIFWPSPVAIQAVERAASVGALAPVVPYLSAWGDLILNGREDEAVESVAEAVIGLWPRH